MKKCCGAASPTSLQRILAAARDLFASRGFHQTAMAELASAAGVSVGMIYRLFEGKAEIIVAIVQEDTDERVRTIAELSDQVKSGEVSVENAFEQLATQALTKSSDALSFEIMAEAHRNAKVADRIGTFCGRFRDVIRDLALAANPALSDDELDGAEEFLLALLFGLSNRNLSRPCLGTGETSRFCVEMVLRALKPTAGWPAASHQPA